MKILLGLIKIEIKNYFGLKSFKLYLSLLCNVD